MLMLYIVCLVFGGVLIAISIFSGMEGDVDVSDVSMDADVDVFDVESDTASADTELGHADYTDGVSAVVQFFNFRNLVFFMAFFGLTGTALTFLGNGVIVSLPASTCMGFLISFIGHKVMIYLRRTETFSDMSLGGLVGSRGNVVVGMTRMQRGKIIVEANDGVQQLLAIVAEESDKDSFNKGDTVTIVGLKEGVVCVAEENFIH